MGAVFGKPWSALSVYTGETFNFVPFLIYEFHKALKAIDHRHFSGPDLIGSYFLILAADFVARAFYNPF